LGPKNEVSDLYVTSGSAFEVAGDLCIGFFLMGGQSFRDLPAGSLAVFFGIEDVEFQLITNYFNHMSNNPVQEPAMPLE
jgi:hypothetical protein